MARAAVLRVPDLVTPQYLFQNLASVHVIDGSWLMKEDARAIWHSSRIPKYCTYVQILVLVAVFGCLISSRAIL